MPHQSSYRVTATVLTAQPVLPVHVTYVTFMAAYTKSSSLATHLFGHDYVFHSYYVITALLGHDYVFHSYYVITLLRLYWVMSMFFILITLLRLYWVMSMFFILITLLRYYGFTRS